MYHTTLLRDSLFASPRAWLLFCALLVAWAAPGSAAEPIEPVVLAEQGAHFTITARYPRLLGEGPANAAANRALHALVTELIQEFRADAEHYAAETTEEPEYLGPPWSLDIDYADPNAFARLLVFRFDGYDFRGGAHGMPFTQIVILDRAEGRALAPEDLFRAGVDWLTPIAEDCRAELAQRDLLDPGDDWLERGTAPEPENYRLLLPEPEGLLVIFPPYAVAPYAAGSQEVVIPYARLAALLDPALFPAAD